MTDLMKHIDQMVVDNTFSLDALDGIKKLKDGFAALERERDEAIEKADLARKSYAETENELAKAQAEVALLRAQVAEDNDTVNAARAAISNADKHAAVAAAYKDAMQIVFKPTVLRESVYRTTNGMTPSSENTSITRESE
jgi:predicted  nucleic acid-binding Zn-ribbon protein